MDQLANLLNQRIADMQRSRGVKAQGMISSERLVSGDTLVKSNTKVVRAGVVIGVAGILLTIALTVAFDALLRRRAAANIERVAPHAPTLGAMPGGVALPALSAPQPQTYALPGADAAARAADETSVLNLQYVSVDKPPASSVPVMLDVDPTADHDSSARAPEDETIVLPLAGGRWAAGKGKDQ
ncbi:hypothetical protein ACFQX7_08475 [Luedemannella flava]